jgi:hypothetical protein
MFFPSTYYADGTCFQGRGATPCKTPAYVDLNDEIYVSLRFSVNVSTKPVFTNSALWRHVTKLLRKLRASLQQRWTLGKVRKPVKYLLRDGIGLREPYRYYGIPGWTQRCVHSIYFSPSTGTCHGAYGWLRLTTAKDRVRSQVTPCRLFGGKKSDTRTGFSESTLSFPCHYHSTSTQYYLV